MPEPLRIYVLTELVTCVRSPRPHVADCHIDAQNTSVPCYKPEPHYRPLELTTVCGTCVPPAWGQERGWVSCGQDECELSDVDVHPHAKRCPDCNGTGRVPVALREVIAEGLQAALKAWWNPDLSQDEAPVMSGELLADAVIAELVAQGEKE